MTRLRLGVNIDHVATVRNARGEGYPDPVRAAEMALAAGADGITAHLREDRRHISDADIDALAVICRRRGRPLNFECAVTPEMEAIALAHRPHAACLVPERREEVTTEGGLDVVRGKNTIAPVVRRMVEAGIRVSMFIDADEAQVAASKAVGAQVVELHTGAYCEAVRERRPQAEALLRNLKAAAAKVHELGLEVHAGHGIDYETVKPIAAIPEVFITAHDAIATQAGLRPGETLLVHGASGGVGSAAVQIGVTLGATVIGISRHADGRTAIERLGGTAIDADGWEDQVLELTGGRGAHVILELVGAPNFAGNMRVIARRGRLAIVGIGAGQKVELMLRDLMTKRATIFGTTLRARPLEEKIEAIQAFHRECGPHLASGRIRPIIDCSFPWNAATEALSRMESSGKVGKVLLDFTG